MNNLQIIQQATETAEIVFKNGLLKQELLQREQIILKLQENISANITKLEEKRIAVAQAQEELSRIEEAKDRRITQLLDNLNEKHNALVETQEQLTLEQTSKIEFTKKSSQEIGLLKETISKQEQKIEEDENAFGILNEKLKTYATEIQKLKFDHNKEIEEMKKVFEERLKEQVAECLKQVKETNTRAGEFRDIADQSTTNLTNVVENININN